MLITDELCVKVSHLFGHSRRQVVSQSHYMMKGGKYLTIGLTRSEKYSLALFISICFSSIWSLLDEGMSKMDEHLVLWRGKDRFLDTL